MEKTWAFTLQFSRIKAQNSIGRRERYRYARTRMFEVPKSEHIKLSDKLTPRMSLKEINDIMGPNGLVPLLLFFVTFPKFPCISNVSPKQAKRFEPPKLLRTRNDISRIKNTKGTTFETTTIHKITHNFWRPGKSI